MNRFDTVILKVFLGGIPVVVGLCVLAAANGWGTSPAASSGEQAANSIVGLLCGTWLVISLYLLARLLISGAFREKVLSRLTFIRERDEREAILTGKAAKTTMLTTLAILLVLFFLSCFRISAYNLPPEEAIGGKTKALTIGIGFSLLENPPQAAGGEAAPENTIVSYSGLPVSVQRLSSG
ncbi:MAG TPA: hypothetical protein VN521_07000 [Negativicutes bacterium]|nr:hypothetical protein [Negativicutes bacterium]